LNVRGSNRTAKLGVAPVGRPARGAGCCFSFARNKEEVQTRCRDFKVIGFNRKEN